MMRRGQILSFPLLLLQLFLYIPSSLRAQTPPPVAPQADDDDPNGTGEKTPSLLVLSISFAPSGEMNVGASSLLSSEGAPSDLKSAVQDALGCALKDQSRYRQHPNYYDGSCVISSARY